MKRTLLAMFFAPLLGAGTARAVEPGGPPPPPPQSWSSFPSFEGLEGLEALEGLPLALGGSDGHDHDHDHAPLPPLPPLPPMGNPAGASASQQLAVKGPVTLRVDGVAIDIEVVAGNGKQVRAQLSDSSGGLRLAERGDRVDVQFEGSSGWPHIPGGMDGHLHVEVPPGSHVELTTASGDIQVRDTGGNVRVRSASGDLRVKHAASVEAMLVSGGAQLTDIAGDVRLRTVSGDAEVRQTGNASVLEFGTTSGDLDWMGGCAGNCRIAARTTSGDVRLALGGGSSWELRYVTHSGDFSDALKAQVIDRRDNGSMHARYGKGEGCIEVQTFSGDLAIVKR